MAVTTTEAIAATDAASKAAGSFSVEGTAAKVWTDRVLQTGESVQVLQINSSDTVESVAADCTGLVRIAPGQSAVGVYGTGTYRVEKSTLLMMLRCM